MGTKLPGRKYKELQVCSGVHALQEAQATNGLLGKKTTQRVHDELRRAQNRKNRNGGTEMAGRRCRGVVEDLRKQVPNHHRCLSIPVGGVVHQLERRAGDQ